MNAQEYLDYLSNRLQVDKIQERTKERLDAQMKQEGKPFVSFEGTHHSGEEVVVEAHNRPTRILNEIESILKGSELELHQNPVLGYLPIMDFNACSTVAPNGDAIILIDILLRSVLQTFTSFLVYLGWEAQKVGNTSRIPESILSIIVKGISSGFRVFLGYRDKEVRTDYEEAWKWMLYKVPPEIPETGDVLCDIIIIFIISHEYAHYVLGHVKPSSIQCYKTPKDQLPIELAMASQSQEKEADQLALEIFMRCHEQNSVFLPFQHIKKATYAPLLFFDIVSVVEATRCFRERPIKLHPPALERKELLYGKVLSCLNEDSKELYGLYSWFIESLRKFVSSENF